MTDQGTLVGGRYELGDLLGRGGMAEVRKGVDVRLGRVVAIKRLRTDLVGDPTFQARFRREAQSAAALNHPAIASVYDTGDEQTTPGGPSHPFIVMEYVPGRTLRDILREGRKILPERALEIVSGVLAALDYSHRAGIIHRDIKPANVMLTPSGDVKVMDFGIARAIADTNSQMTQTSAVVGTAQYLSPEQARGDQVDARSDIYSAGCLLYELLTLRPPFSGESPVSVAYQHVREQAPVPSAVDASLPPAIDAIVMKALAKDPEDRYQSAGDMRTDIDRYLAGQPVNAPAPLIPLEPEEGTQVLRPVSDRRAPKPRNPWPFIALGAAVVALIVAAAFIGVRLFGSSTPTVSVPRVTGMTVEQATAELDSLGLVLGTQEPVASSEVEEGQIISQSPDPLTEVEEGTAIDVQVSTGEAQATIPPLIGQNVDEAIATLDGLGFTDIRKQEEDAEEDENSVIAVEPPPGSEVPLSATITVTYSTGPIEVPNIVGKTEAVATAQLQDAGFNVRVFEDATTEAQAGTVLSQDPEPKTKHKRGTTIYITVSRYVPPAPTPEPPVDTPDPGDGGDGGGE